MFLLLIVTGISLHYASAEGSLIPFQLSVGIHNICAIILTINYGIFVIGNMIIRKWHVLPKVEKEPLAQTLETVYVLCRGNF